MNMTPFEKLLRRWRMHMVSPFIQNGSRILDVGSQEGALFQKLQTRDVCGVGIDPLVSPKNCGNFTLIQGTFPDQRINGPFDAITMLAVFEHFPPEQLTEIISECHKLLRPEGIIVMTVPDPKVDTIILWLMALRLINGVSHEEHHGFDPRTVPSCFPSSQWIKVEERTFQSGLNNLFAFKKI